MKLDYTDFKDLRNIPFLEDGDITKTGRTFHSSFNELLKKYDAMVFYDTETTGLDAQAIDELGQPLQIIELSALRIEMFNGRPEPVDGMDEFIQMNNNGKMPPSIIAFNEEHQTGITDELIKKEGISEKDAVNMFDRITKGNVLMVAYNAQFDMCFVHEMLQRSGVGEQKNIIHSKDHLDPLTIYRDRAPFAVFSRLDGTDLPRDLQKGHKLEFAIAYYGVDGYVQNSHRAIDDVKSMYAVIRKMDEQKSDLESYVGVIGVSPKYGLSGMEHPNITYCPQQPPERGERYPKLKTVPSIVNSVQIRFEEIHDMNKLATELSILMLKFSKEFEINRISTNSNLAIAKLENQKPFLISKLEEESIKKTDFPAFSNIKKWISSPNEFAKELMNGNESVLLNVKDFLKEVQDTKWASPELRYSAQVIKDKQEQLSQELKMAPSLKLGRSFKDPNIDYLFEKFKEKRQPKVIKNNDEFFLR